jgi:hypothetical protein
VLGCPHGAWAAGRRDLRDARASACKVVCMIKELGVEWGWHLASEYAQASFRLFCGVDSSHEQRAQAEGGICFRCPARSRSPRTTAPSRSICLILITPACVPLVFPPRARTNSFPRTSRFAELTALAFQRGSRDWNGDEAFLTSPSSPFPLPMHAPHSSTPAQRLFA